MLPILSITSAIKIKKALKIPIDFEKEYYKLAAEVTRIEAEFNNRERGYKSRITALENEIKKVGK